MPKSRIPYKRVLLKISGEALHSNGHCLSPDIFSQVSKQIQDLVLHDIEVGIVIGGGNIFRGVMGDALGLERTSSDQMGMLATLINGIALAESLKKIGIKAEVLSALHCSPVLETYSWQKAREYLGQKKVVIFVGGTGSPFFTTDTAAALRASEIKADILLKATQVDGVYTKDPKKYPDAKRFDKISYTEVLAQKLDVMDATSVALCMQSKIPILVFNLGTKAKLTDVLQNETLSTRIG